MNNPSASQFRKNSFLTTIAHAVWIVADPTLAYERRWAGDVYCVDDSSGTRGAVYEGSGPLVGAAFNQKSRRNPMHVSAEPFDKNPKDFPPDYVSLLNKVTGLLLKDPQNGSDLVTSIFWETSGILTSNESWERTLENGAEVFQYELMEETEALSEVKEGYEFDDQVMSIVERIFRQRIGSQGQIVIDKQTWEFIMSRGEAGIKECRERLASINVAVPI